MVSDLFWVSKISHITTWHVLYFYNPIIPQTYYLMEVFVKSQAITWCDCLACVVLIWPKYDFAFHGYPIGSTQSNSANAPKPNYRPTANIVFSLQ